VRDAIAAWQPDAVFVELDAGRLRGLLERARTGADPPGGTFLQRRLQGFQRSVAAQYGAEAGEEMLAAVQAGQAVGARVLLVDRPAQVTLDRARKALGLRERLRAAGLVLAGVVKGFGRRASVEKEVQRYQEDPTAALADVAGKFPNLYRVLITERDEMMANGIRRGLAGARLGVAIVGDGHVPGLLARLGDLAPAVYRLGDVREGRLPRGLVARGDAQTVRFGFDAGTGPATGAHHNP
jgi:pheromone shutdown protein TraB